MNQDLFPVLLGALDLGSTIGLVIPVVAIVIGGVIAIGGMYFHHNQKKLVHDTARLALEKGQPVPPELLAQLSDREKSYPRRRDEPGRDIRTGLILVAVGFGLYVFFSSFAMASMRYVGAIPGFIGLALLLYGFIAHRAAGNRPPGGEHSAKP
ncbi:MAG: hypothetical protein RLZZ15_2518 [Verrucomicrobiota bacterium]|jgi:hypothetical protein